MANIFRYAIIVVTLTSFVTSHPAHKPGNTGRRTWRKRHRHRHGKRQHNANGGDPKVPSPPDLNILPSTRAFNLSSSASNYIDDILQRQDEQLTEVRWQGNIPNLIGNNVGNDKTHGQASNRPGDSRSTAEYENRGLSLLNTEPQPRETEVPRSRTEQHISGKVDTLLDNGFPSSGPYPLSSGVIETNAIRDSAVHGVKEKVREGQPTSGRRRNQLRDSDTTSQRGVGCSLEICENMLNPGNRHKTRPLPVPLKSNTMKQVEDSRPVIVQYNDQLTETVPNGILPPIPNHQMIVNLTGEEDDEVMENFGSFFHDFKEVPPSDNNFRTRDGRGSDREKRSSGGRHIYVCAHERIWEDFSLAFSASNGLVQLYQTKKLRQYVLSNRCTEQQSSVVPHVICVNEISTVNVVVLNFDTWNIQPTFINVETCRAKFVT